MWLQQLLYKIYNKVFDKLYVLHHTEIIDDVEVRYYWRLYKPTYHKRFVTIPLMFRGNVHEITRIYKLKRVKHGTNKNRYSKGWKERKGN